MKKCLSQTIIIVISLMIYRIAFENEPLPYIRWLEFAIDVVLLVNMLSIFLTAQINDTTLIKNPCLIAKRYLTTYFVIDVLSFLPSIITVESIGWVYYFKVCRFMQVQRMFNWVSFTIKRTRKYFLAYQEKFDNINTLLM